MRTASPWVTTFMALAACEPRAPKVVDENTTGPSSGNGGGGAAPSQGGGGSGHAQGGGGSAGGSGGGGPCSWGGALSVAGCVAGLGIDPSQWRNVDVDTAGVVTSSGPVDLASTCLFHGGTLDPSRPPVFQVRFDDASAQAWEVAFEVPGYDDALLQIGDAVTLAYHAKYGEGGGSDYFTLRENGSLVVSVGSSDADPEVSVTAGALVCAYSSSCDVEVHDMDVAIGAESASIPNGESREVGALTVTNGHFARLFDTGGCNAFDPTFLIGIAAN
jgi:hypothetical protein